MSFARSTLLKVGSAAIGFVVAASGLAIAFDPWGQSTWSYMRGGESVAVLGDKHGIYVEKGSFRVRVAEAKGDPVAAATRMGGKELANGAIIFRAGDKLYLVDTKPSGE